MISKLLNLLPKGDFFKNVLTLITGTTIAQVVPLLSYPLLTRLYTPSDFGLLGVFVSIYTILSVFATGKYELAIVLAKKNKEAVTLVYICLIINIVFSLFLLLVIIIFNNKILDLSGNQSLGYWLYFIPLVVFLLGIFQTFTYYNTREEDFKEISKSRIAKSISLSTVQVLVGISKFSSIGLILGNIVSNFTSNLNLIKTFIKKEGVKINNSIKIKELKEVSRKHINFPKYILFSTLLNTASVQLPIIIFSIYYSSSFVGQFTLSQKVLSLPMILIGGAIGQVYYQKIAKNSSDNIVGDMTMKLYKVLLSIGIVPLVFVLFFGDSVFSFVFGNEWLHAGEYARLISMWVLFVFISSPLSSVLFAKGLQKQALYFQLVVFFSRIAVIYYCIYFERDEYTTVLYYGIVGFIVYVLLTFYVFYKINIKMKEVLRFSLPIFAIVFCVMFIIKLIIENWN